MRDNKPLRVCLFAFAFVTGRVGMLFAKPRIGVLAILLISALFLPLFDLLLKLLVVMPSLREEEEEQRHDSESKDSPHYGNNRENFATGGILLVQLLLARVADGPITPRTIASIHELNPTMAIAEELAAREAGSSCWLIADMAEHIRFLQHGRTVP
jgi:hypothetical protein